MSKHKVMEYYCEVVDNFNTKNDNKKNKTRNTFRTHEKQNLIEKKNLNSSRKKMCRLVNLKIRRNSNNKKSEYLLF